MAKLVCRGPVDRGVNVSGPKFGPLWWNIILVRDDGREVRQASSDASEEEAWANARVGLEGGPLVALLPP